MEKDTRHGIDKTTSQIDKAYKSMHATPSLECFPGHVKITML